MIFALEPIDTSPDETVALWEGHWAETEEAYRKSPLNPDWAQFKRLDEVGWGRYFTARVDGKLAGHLYFILHTNRHTQTRTAVEDFYYFTPAHRRGMNAVKLLRFAVTILKAEGAEQIGMSSKLTGGKNIDPILKRVGFKHVANFFVM